MSISVDIHGDDAPQVNGSMYGHEHRHLVSLAYVAIRRDDNTVTLHGLTPDQIIALGEQIAGVGRRLLTDVDPTPEIKANLDPFMPAAITDPEDDDDEEDAEEARALAAQHRGM